MFVEQRRESPTLVVHDVHVHLRHGADAHRQLQRVHRHGGNGGQVDRRDGVDVHAGDGNRDADAGVALLLHRMGRDDGVVVGLLDRAHVLDGRHSVVCGERNRVHCVHVHQIADRVDRRQTADVAHIRHRHTARRVYDGRVHHHHLRLAHVLPMIALEPPIRSSSTDWDLHQCRRPPPRSGSRSRAAASSSPPSRPCCAAARSPSGG